MKLRFDIDTYREILDTLTRNKSRSLLTGFGVFWGVFMLIGLMGGGQGLKEMLENEFAGFATNSALIWSQPTTKPYKGFRKGRQWEMVYKDVNRLKAQVPELNIVTPMVSRWGNSAVYGDKRNSCHMSGVMPEYAQVMEPKIVYGRYLNDVDLKMRRKVCVIGKKVYKELFPGGGDPCGKMIRVDSVYYRVVGVDYKDGGVNINGRSEEAVTVPLTLMQQTYNMGNQVDIISVTAKPGVVMSEITDRMREVIARAHTIDPADEQGVMVFNTELLFSMMDNLFKGVNFLIWLVGLGTLLAGAIGVSNIMMVTVKERTTEIGIRRAIGATPKMILSQIMLESVLLTLAFGLLGIVFSVMVLSVAEIGVSASMEMAVGFQVSFGAAMLAVLILTVLGLLAGLAPAARAMNIKPVDAMRDE